MNVLAKMGDFDNVSLYEYYCDTKADLDSIPPEKIGLGSTAIVIHGENGIEAYIAASDKEWIPIAFDSGSGEGIIPEGTLDIVANGVYDITEKAEVNVKVPNPSTGTLNITENGVYNVQEKAEVDVDVPNPSTGSINITSNDTYDVTNVATAVVNVPNPSSGSIDIVENGTYNVVEKAEVNVDVPNPSTGEITIIENGTYDVTELASAIVNVPTSSGGSEADTSKPVRFIDYDGTTVYSYTPEEFAELTAMPENPDHSGDEIPLTSQGWNWNLTDAQSYVADYGALDIGQMYITTDGKTHIKIYIDPATPANRRVMTLRWRQRVGNGVTVDWGDGTTPETYAGTSEETHGHTYAGTGWFDITLDVTSGTIRFGALSIVGSNTSDSYYKRTMIRDVRFGNGLAEDALMGAFSNCYSLTSVTIPESVTAIGSDTFSNCYSLTSVTIPESVTAIGSSAFSNCCSLTSVTIPDGVTAIGSSAFRNCNSLTSITIPEGVTSIESYAFTNCYSLTSISIPEGVTSIGSYAVQYCYSLTSISIPEGVTNIWSYAVQYCYSLTSITIPEGITSIGSNAFGGCSSVSEYHLLPTTPPTIQSNTFSSIASDCIIYVPYSADHSILTAYQNATNWSTHASKMQEEPQP